MLLHVRNKYLTIFSFHLVNAKLKCISVRRHKPLLIITPTKMQNQQPHPRLAKIFLGQSKHRPLHELWPLLVISLTGFHTDCNVTCGSFKYRQNLCNSILVRIQQSGMASAFSSTKRKDQRAYMTTPGQRKRLNEALKKLIFIKFI